MHGYDIQSLAVLDRFRFASGADEKVIRVFEAPLKFMENFSNLTGVDLSKDIEEKVISFIQNELLYVFSWSIE